MKNSVETKYGIIATVIEWGKIKIDFDNCVFNKPFFGMLDFLNDKDELFKITGY